MVRDNQCMETKNKKRLIIPLALVLALVVLLAVLSYFLFRAPQQIPVFSKEEAANLLSKLDGSLWFFSERDSDRLYEIMGHGYKEAEIYVYPSLSECAILFSNSRDSEIVYAGFTDDRIKGSSSSGKDFYLYMAEEALIFDFYTENKVIEGSKYML